jgi:5-methylcytosine-specific restriction endonuclease McrA
VFFKLLRRRDAYERHPEGAYFEYSEYRSAIAEDCEFTCVYCDSHEDVVGGRESMELDHFRPWNKGFGEHKEKRFEHLKHDPTNLVHACGVCNGFKWAHWPTEDPDRPYDNEKGWIDPFAEARSDFLEVQEEGEVRARRAPGQYVIGKLRLNRPLLRRQREMRALMDRWDQTTRIEWEAKVAEDPNSEAGKIAGQALLIVEILRKKF